MTRARRQLELDPAQHELATHTLPKNALSSYVVDDATGLAEPTEGILGSAPPAEVLDDDGVVNIHVACTFVGVNAVGASTQSVRACIPGLFQPGTLSL